MLHKEERFPLVRLYRCEWNAALPKTVQYLALQSEQILDFVPSGMPIEGWRQSEVGGAAAAIPDDPLVFFSGEGFHFTYEVFDRSNFD